MCLLQVVVNTLGEILCIYYIIYIVITIQYFSPNDRVSSRIECNVTAQSPDELNTFISNYEKVEMYLMRNLGIEDFSITGKFNNVSID